MHHRHFESVNVSLCPHCPGICFFGVSALICHCHVLPFVFRIFVWKCWKAGEETAHSAMDFVLDHLQWPVDRVWPMLHSPSKSCMIVCKMIATWFSNDSATAALVQLDDTKSLHTNDPRHPHHAATIYRNKLKSEMEVSSWQRNCAWKLYQSYSILIQFRFTYWVLRMIYHCYEIQLIIRVSRTRWWYLVARLAPDQQWPSPLLLVLQANVLWLLAFETCGKMWDVDFEEAHVW